MLLCEDGKTSGIVVYLKPDERLNDFIKIKNKYYIQSQNDGLNNAEKKQFKLFQKDYENYKNLYNKKNHQNINEIREVIAKYGENAKII